MHGGHRVRFEVLVVMPEASRTRRFTRIPCGTVSKPAGTGRSSFLPVSPQMATPEPDAVTHQARTSSARSRAQGTELMPPIPETVCEYRGAGAGGDKFAISTPRTVILTKVRTQIVKGYFRQAGSDRTAPSCGISARSRAPRLTNWALTEACARESGCQGDGVCWSVGAFLPTLSISPGRRPAEAGRRSGTDRRSFLAMRFPSIPALRPAEPGGVPGKPRVFRVVVPCDSSP